MLIDKPETVVLRHREPAASCRRRARCLPSHRAAAAAPRAAGHAAGDGVGADDLALARRIGGATLPPAGPTFSGL